MIIMLYIVKIIILYFYETIIHIIDMCYQRNNELNILLGSYDINSAKRLIY